VEGWGGFGSVPAEKRVGDVTMDVDEKNGFSTKKFG
jgi:hypothetical protein